MKERKDFVARNAEYGHGKKQIHEYGKLMNHPAKLELTTYHDREVVLPDYCRDLKVYRICEDDLPVVYVLTKPLLKEVA